MDLKTRTLLACGSAEVMLHHTMQTMPDLPVMLKIAGRRCVILGGGRVALRRATALLDAKALVTVIAPDIGTELASLPVALERRPYREGDIAGAVLVVIATDNAPVNRAAAEEARRAGVLVNRADDPEAGDLSIPAHAHHGSVTLAVHTGGASATASAIIRRQLSEALDPDWPRLLELVAPYRPRIQAVVADPRERSARLARLADLDALTTLKTSGPQALLQRCEELLTPDTHNATPRPT